MPKSMPINPSDVRKKGKLKLEPIPLNVYDRKLKDEVAAYGADEVRAVYHDMVAIRMFETMRRAKTSPPS